MLAHLAFWLDHVDGQVARWRGTASLDGVYFDYLMHHAANLGLGFGLGYGLAARTGDLRWSAAGFAIALGWTMLGLHNDCRYKAFFQRLKRETGTFRVDGGSGGRPSPPAPWPRRGRAALTWPAYKACEPHVVLIGLTALAVLALVAPALWLMLWRGGVGVMAVLAPALAFGRAARTVTRQAVSRGVRPLVPALAGCEPRRQARGDAHPGHARASRYHKAEGLSDSLVTVVAGVCDDSTERLPSDLGHLPAMPRRRDVGIGVVGAGFIVRDCHLVAYADAGFQVVGLTSRTEATAREVAALRGVPRVFATLEAMLDDPEVEVVDVAVPPTEQPGVIRRILDHPRTSRPRHPGAEAAGDVLSRGAGDRRGVRRGGGRPAGQPEHAVRPLGARLQDAARPRRPRRRRCSPRSTCGPSRTGCPGPEDGRSLSTFIMSIHHLDTFRYWLGDPLRVLASTRPDPRTKFPHADGINLYILEYEEARASAWDDVWAGPVREGAAAEIGIRWRFEGTHGLALGTIGWPGWPERVPSTIDYSTVDDQGAWHRPRWPEAWFPDAFAGTMAGLLRALESGTEPDISGRDNLKTIALCEAVLSSAASIAWSRSKK